MTLSFYDSFGVKFECHFMLKESGKKSIILVLFIVYSNVFFGLDNMRHFFLEFKVVLTHCHWEKLPKFLNPSRYFYSLLPLFHS